MRPIGTSVALDEVKEPPTGSRIIGVASFWARASAGKVTFCLIVGLAILAGFLLMMCAFLTPSSLFDMVGGVGRVILFIVITCRYCGTYGRWW